MNNISVNLERIQRTLDQVVQFNATPDCGYSRFSYSQEDRKVRQYLSQLMKQCGMDVKTDAVGNIRARLSGTNPDRPVIMAGSHIDTVYHGGKYDGALGVVAALEVVNVVTENNISLNYPYEVIIFAEEEGSNFGVTTLGSKCLAGECTLEYLMQLVNPQGISSYQMMKDFGLNPDNLYKDVIKEDEIYAMLELHIEQSVVLENNMIELGIVEEVAGRKAYLVKMHGASGHAGATPMDQRKDALVGASEVISSLAEVINQSGGRRTVVTVGKMECEPNVSNSIVGKVEFTLDIRDVEESWMRSVADHIKQKLSDISAKHALEFEMILQGESDGMYLSQDIARLAENTANDLGVKSLRMVSGAVHDAALLAKLTQVGMVFIPSVGGVSHVPHEHSTPESIQTGCNVLLQTILKLSNSEYET